MTETEVVASKESQLAASISRLYTAVAPYRLRPHMDAYPCCVYDRDQRRVSSQSLRALTVADLEKYAFKAMSTWGDDRDFRHFLPRLFELQALEGLAPWDVEILFGKLAYAHWRTWPEAEQRAVEEYLAAVWQYLLVSRESDIVIDEYLCGIAQAVDDLSPFLSVWEQGDHPTAVRNFIAFVDSNRDATQVQHGILNNPFWKGHEEQRQQVFSWLVDPLTHRRLRESRAVQTDEGLGDELARVAIWLSKVGTDLP